MAKPAFLVVALLHFSSMEAIGGAMGGPFAAEVFGDVPNFTNITPVARSTTRSDRSAACDNFDTKRQLIDQRHHTPPTSPCVAAKFVRNC